MTLSKNEIVKGAKKILGGPSIRLYCLNSKNIYVYIIIIIIVEQSPTWYSPTTPKPEYHKGEACVYWNVTVFAENTEVRANRIGTRIMNKQTLR